MFHNGLNFKAHAYAADLPEAVEATCQHVGLTEGSHCSICGEVLKAQEELPMQGHYYFNGVCIWCARPRPAVTTPARSSSRRMSCKPTCTGPWRCASA